MRSANTTSDIGRMESLEDPGLHRIAEGILLPALNRDCDYRRAFTRKTKFVGGRNGVSPTN